MRSMCWWGVWTSLDSSWKNFSPAPGFVVQRHEQAVLRPDARTAPRCLGRRLVDRGADAVARADDGFHRHARAARPALEMPDAFEQVVLECRGIGIGRHAADLRNEVQQGIGRGHERIAAAHDIGQARRLGAGLGTGAAGRCGRGHGPGGLARMAGGENVDGVLHGHVRFQRRMAHISSCSSGKPPETCSARPPEFCNWRHRSCPVSSSK